jgi:HEAT repeat protein
MAVDFISIGIGAGVAVILATMAFLLRERVTLFRTMFTRGAENTRARLSKNIDTRYREAIVAQANTWHVAGHLIPLEHVAILPRFYTLPDPFNPLEEEDEGGYHGPFSLVPITPDWPQAMASYQLKGISLERILRGHDFVALLGLPGSGRSVALALMAILTARQKEDNQAGGLLEIARMPGLLHLADVELDPALWGSGADPIGPMISAAELRLKGMAANWLHAVQAQFTTGYGLILMDGWDELTPAEQEKVTEWIKVLKESYPGNKIVITASPNGYRPLQELGFAPTFMMPWGQPEFNDLGNIWTEAWPKLGGTPDAPAAAPEAEMMRRAVRGNRSRLPLDITLKIWAAFAGDDPGQGRRGWYSAYVNRVNPAPELRGALERLGETDLNTPDQAGLTLEEATAVIDGARTTAGKASFTTPDFLYALTNETLLLTERANKRISFVQPVISAYLAAESLRDSNFRETLLDGRTASNLTMSFLGAMQDIGQYVEVRMADSPTILRDNLLHVALWAADADPRATWRSGAFKKLAQFMLSPSEFPLVRERTMAALVASRDPNVAFIFRQGMQSEDPRIRILSTLGLGALGDPETVTALGDMLNDPDASVAVAATLALGAMGTKPALDYMLNILLSGIEMARRGVAEMLATDLLGEGHSILREAVAEQDPQTRRAAVFGLERVAQDWVMPLLAEVEVRDDQWLVRTAASNALKKLRDIQVDTPRRRPLPEESPWLGHWLADRDEDLMVGSGGVSQLIRALQEGNEAIRLAAAEALGAIAQPDCVTPLYAALRDSHAEVRDAAYRALGATSAVTGKQLPGVT